MTSPSVYAYFVSHQEQRSGHPVVLTNTQGSPAKVDSPWMLRNNSLILRSAMAAH